MSVIVLHRDDLVCKSLLHALESRKVAFIKTGNTARITAMIAEYADVSAVVLDPDMAIDIQTLKEQNQGKGVCFVAAVTSKLAISDHKDSITEVLKLKGYHFVFFLEEENAEEVNEFVDLVQTMEGINIRSSKDVRL